MYIRKQPSGSTRAHADQRRRGRGEYELSGSYNARPPIPARDLLDKSLVLHFGRYGFKETGNVIRLRHGKKRLQLMDRTIHIHAARQVEGALLLPKSRRDEHGLIGGQPVIVSERYILRQMHFRELEVIPQSAKVSLGALDLYNGSQEESIDFRVRMSQVEAVHDAAAKFPDDIRDRLREHRRILESSVPMQTSVEAVVVGLMDALVLNCPDYDLFYIAGMDPLAALNEILNQPTYDKPFSLPAIPQEDSAMRHRELLLWHRWASSRGAASASFCRRVREAYNFSCMVCGMCLPPIGDGAISGVDAVYIAPWAAEGADTVSNGICLCKLHRWAYERQLLRVVWDGRRYSVAVTDSARRALGQTSLGQLEQFEKSIPNELLPFRDADKPSPEMLRIYAENAFS